MFTKTQTDAKNTVAMSEVAHACNPRWITRSRDQDHPGQHGETPSLLKFKKLAGHGGACL